MAECLDALRRALAPLEKPLQFAGKNDQALLSLRGLDALAARAAAEAEKLPLDDAKRRALERLVLAGRSFSVQSADQRRRSLAEMAAEIALLLNAPADGAPAPAPEHAPDAPSRLRVRPLSQEGSAAPIATDSEALSLPLSNIRGVGPSVAEKLAARSLRTVGDALLFLPRRYEDRRHVTPIRSLRAGRTALVRGRVVAFRERFVRKHTYELDVEDDTGVLTARWFVFRPAAYAHFVPGAPLVLSGEVREGFRGRLEVVHPDLEMGAGDDPASFGRIIPVYTEIEGVSARFWRRISQRVVDNHVYRVREYLPERFRATHRLPTLSEALAAVHFPPDEADFDELQRFHSPSQRRLVFDELFFVQVGLALRRRGVKVEAGIPLHADESVLAKATARLPFALTGAQRRSLDEIAADLGRPSPMNRLLQGDVGSGKTAVALAAALVAVENGHQAAIMAPTELLAEQHHRTFRRLLGADLFEGRRDLPPVGLALLTAGRKPAELRRSVAEVESGTARIVVGTHALIQEGVKFRSLALAVIDEQHRFGVLQRARLMEKGAHPHVLVMTATPIPRTLALTLYGDLDVSIIDELPPGRTPVTTRTYSEKTRDKAYELVRREVRAGRQAYVVLPLVEESEKLDLRAATEEYERLSREEFADLKVGLAHGRMGTDERNAAMEAFRRGDVQVLVATTVIEVGVDVPNASVMLVDHAERFGLSQLHQLRGRVGRGAAKSWCLLVAGAETFGPARERLRVMTKTADGFRIAEADLAIRGPGEFLGTRQSGMPDLVIADLLRDQAILKEAREAAFALVEADPALADPAHRAMAAELERRWAGKISLARVG